MLDADRATVDDGVEPRPVDRPGHRIVVPDGPDPRLGWKGAIRGPQRGDELRRRAHVGRTGGNGRTRRRHRHEMDVMVAEPGQERATPGLDHRRRPRGARSRRPKSYDPAGGDLDVHPALAE
jgi:hypothetical protein